MEENVKRMLDGGLALFDDPQLIDLLEHHRSRPRSSRFGYGGG